MCSRNRSFQSTSAPVVYETVGSVGEYDAKLQQLAAVPAPTLTTQSGYINQTVEQPSVTVVHQDVIEKHIQPVVTELREQTVVQEVEHPIVRKYIEEPIVRQVDHNKIRHYTQDSGQFETMNIKWSSRDVDGIDLHKRSNSLSLVPIVAPGAPITTTPAPELFAPQVLRQASPQMNQDALEAISCAGKNSLWGLSRRHEVYKLIETVTGSEWQYHPTNGLLFRDISAAPRGLLFGVGLSDGYLYRVNGTKIELVLKDDFTKVTCVSAQSRRKIYAIGADGTVLFLHLKLVGANKNATFEPIGGQMKKISVGGKHAFRKTELWGIGYDNMAYRYFNGQWLPHQQVFLSDISVSDDNAVYGVRMEDGRLVKWDGNNLFALQERNVINNPDAKHSVLTNVTAYKESRQVYAVERGTGNILKMEL